MPPADTAADNPNRVAEAAAAYESAPVEQDPAVAGAQTLERLREHGFDRNQARGVVYAVRALAGDLSAKAEVGEVKKDVKRIKEEVVGLKDAVAAVKEDVVELKADNRILKAGMAGLRDDVERIEKTMAATMSTKESLELARKDVARVEETMATLAIKEALSHVENILPTLATKDALALVQKDVEHIKSTMVTEEVLVKRLMSSNRWVVGIVVATVGIVVATVGVGVAIILNALAGLS